MRTISRGTGDTGETRLGDGSCASKDDPRVVVYGTIDELNSFLGLFLAGYKGREAATVKRVQRELFALGADVSTPLDKKQVRIRDGDSRLFEDSEFNNLTGSYRIVLLGHNNKEYIRGVPHIGNEHMNAVEMFSDELAHSDLPEDQKRFKIKGGTLMMSFGYISLYYTSERYGMADKQKIKEILGKYTTKEIRITD